LELTKVCTNPGLCVVKNRESVLVLKVRWKFRCVVKNQGKSLQDVLVKVPLVNCGVTATQALTCRPILSRHYAGMTQDGLWIAGTLGGGGVGLPHPLTYIHTPTLT
jgi:hypothetical protein